MNPADEAVPPPAAPPTPADVLRWIAAGGAGPWFASAHARATGTPRDSLDPALNALLQEGLVKAVTWVRGAGQGYAVTPAGTAALAGAVPTPPPVAPTPAAAPPVADRPAVVTPVLVGLNLVWFFAGAVVAVRVGGGLGDYLAGRSPLVLARTGGVSGPDLLRGDWWRLLTACFVHVGALHLAVNMLNLGLMGPVAELLWGRGRVVVIYLLAGLAGSCLAMASRPEVMVAGASGALWGVQSALLAWLLINRARLASAAAAELFRRLGVAFALGIGVSLVPRVSWEAHLGGGLAGFAAAGLLHLLRAGGRPRRWAAGLLLVLIPGVSVCGLLAVMESGAPWAPLRAREAEPGRIDELNREVGPLLTAIQPAAMKPVRDAAVGAWLAPAGKRSAAILAVRARVELLRQAAADAEAKTTGPPTGADGFDRAREKARLAAAARVRELDLLLKTLDPAHPPDAAAWERWGAARRDADRAWDELPRR